VVPGVEALGAEFDTTTSIFIEGEFLEEGEIPVLSPWTAQTIEPKVAPCSRRRSSKRRRAEPSINRLGIGNRSYKIRSNQDIASRKNVGHGGVACAARRSATDIERRACLRGYDARQLPSSNGCLQEMVAAVSEQRNFVDEVDKRSVPSVER
jgi:hypothetical protein